MTKFVILILILAACATVECGILKKLFHHETTTTTTTVAPRQSIFFNNNLPKIENGCMAKYKCQSKIAIPASTTKLCVKYCLKEIGCGNNPKVFGKPHECVELNEAMVRREHEELSALEHKEVGATISPMRVAMIDFPCQPGYLPDSRGRCREVW